MNLTPGEKRVFDFVLALHKAEKPIKTSVVAAELDLSRRSAGHHLANLRDKGLIVLYLKSKEWALTPAETVELPETWNINRAAAFGITVRVVDDAKIGGELMQVGFDWDFLWPKEQTNYIDWQMDLNAAVRKAVHVIISKTASGMNVSEMDAELYLVRHARVRTERRERREVMA